MNHDLRQRPRRLFKTLVVLTLSEGGHYQGKSHDISSTGMCLLLQHKNLKPGQSCTVYFEILVQQKVHRITASAKIAYSICSQDGFKTGLHFTKMDLSCSSALEAFMA
jgi:c-di-GMP-binding flagellar brake protein YcgR